MGTSTYLALVCTVEGSGSQQLDMFGSVTQRIDAVFMTDLLRCQSTTFLHKKLCLFPSRD